MTLSVLPRRWPNLFLALLAVAGLMTRAHAAPPIGGFAAFPVAVCHSDSGGDRRAPDVPMADCDACLMCVGAHGGAVAPLVPVGFVLGRVSHASVVRPTLAGATEPRVVEPRVYRARGPPAAA